MALSREEGEGGSSKRGRGCYSCAVGIVILGSRDKYFPVKVGRRWSA